MRAATSDATATLERAAAFLRPAAGDGGSQPPARVVIAHYRGAASAREEHHRSTSNAPSLYPTLKELRALARRLKLKVRPPSELGVPGPAWADDEETLERFYLVALERA